MGRQIRFVHTERDIHSFLTVIEKHQRRIVENDQTVLPTSMEDAILSKMSSHVCRYHITAAHEGPTGKRLLDGTLIEFSNCVKGCAASRTYQVGRLYIRPNSVGDYDAETLSLYQKLSAHLKRHYRYSPKAQIYASTAFWEKYASNYYHILDAVRNIEL